MAVSSPGVMVSRPAATRKSASALTTVILAHSCLGPPAQLAVLDHAVEAGAEADVAAPAVALRQHLHQHSVLVAVDAQLDHLLHLPAGLALAPEFASRAAEEPHL